MTSGEIKKQERKTEYIGFTLPSEKRRQLEEIANRNDRSLAAQVRILISQAMEAFES
jgi:hypothetical protein